MHARPIPIGVVPGLLGFVAVAALQKRARAPALLYLQCFLLAAGGWQLLRVLPVFRMVRFPFGWVLLALFPFGWVAAVGCDSLIAPGKLGAGARRWGLRVVSWSGLALALVWLYAFHRSRHGSFPFFDVNVGTPVALALGVAGGLSLALTAWAAGSGRIEHAAIWLAPLFVLTLSHIAATPQVSDPAPFEPPGRHGMVATLHGSPREIRGRVFSMHDILYGYEVTDRLPSPLGIEISFLPHRCRRILESLRYLPTLGAIDWQRFAIAKGFFDSMDLQYVAAHVALAPLLRSHGFDLVRMRGADALFVNRNALGSAWVNYSVRVVQHPDDILRYVLGSAFDPHREAIVERRLSREYPLPSEGTPLAVPPESMTRRSPTDLEITVNGTEPGVLVVSESSYPGWTATLDGAPVTWFTVDYVLRGVEIGAGHHVVRYRYAPPSLRYGLAASALGLLAIAGLFFRARRATTGTPRP